MLIFLLAKIYLFFLPCTHAEDLWWKSTSIYQLYPLSVSDSDGDGIGDIKGITSKLYWYYWFGVETLWLTPIYPSPMKDFGYDVSNYLDVNPIFGSMDDFVELVEEARYYKLKIILDFVPNHSSDQHEWFQKSLKNEWPYSDYYVWADPIGWEENVPIPPNNWLSKVRTSAWEWSSQRGQFYYHQYQAAQPDLNYRNGLVIEEMKEILSFWLDLGIDGVRMDAVSHLIEDDKLKDEPKSGENVDDLDWNSLEHIYTNNQNLTRDILSELTSFIKENYGSDKFVVLETDLSSPEIMQYYDCGDIPFNFELARGIKNNVSAVLIKNLVEQWMDNMPHDKIANWVTGSHDISRIASRVSDDFVDHMNMLALMLPGISVTYQGEEIGMTNMNISWEDTLDPAGLACGQERYQECSRDPERTPYHWSSDKNAGFSVANKTWLPVNPNYEWINMMDQFNPIHSHLQAYMNAMRARNVLKTIPTPIYLVIENVFIALHADYILVLNFDADIISIEMEELLFENGIETEMYTVFARSTNGTQENEVGERVYFYDTLVIGSKEAFILVRL